MPSHRRVKCVGKGVLEDAEEISIDHVSIQVADGPLNQFGPECPTFRYWSLVRQFQGTITRRATVIMKGQHRVPFEMERRNTHCGYLEYSPYSGHASLSSAVALSLNRVA
jgi:hypothetical protein